MIFVNAQFLFNRVFIVRVNRLPDRDVNTTKLDPLKLALKNYLVDDVEANYYLKAVVMVEKIEGQYIYSTYAYMEIDKKWFFTTKIICFFTNI